MDASNIGTYFAEVASDYAFSDSMSVGGKLAYQTGVDSNEMAKYETNSVSMALYGSYVF